MLLCPQLPRSASGEPRGHGRVGPSAALRPGGSAAASSTASSVAAASPGHCPRRLLPARRPRPFPSPPPLLLLLLLYLAVSAPLAARGSGKEWRARGPAPPAVEPDLQYLGAPGFRAGVVGQRECRNSWGGRKKVLVQTPATVVTLAILSAAFRQRRPVCPWGPRVPPGEPQSWAWGEGRRAGLNFFGEHKKECPKPTAFKGIAFPPLCRDLEPPLGTA
ncbi:unnamed protein product [Rangifer tarandus platyrhynchus]|uniref:Uncharacterized protein n=1 Tax=Rangifer tarandus platyrhynchus TaxID=3082113 RepID=A0ABN8YBI0_RANTA|nr:unnamed protein product [Rangifer tarandus platyrhynchus]